MITLKRLDLIRGVSEPLAAELQGLQTQINQACLSPATQTTVGSAGSASAPPATPTGYLTVTIRGTEYVLPFYAKE